MKKWEYRGLAICTPCCRMLSLAEVVARLHFVSRRPLAVAFLFKLVLQPTPVGMGC